MKKISQDLEVWRQHADPLADGVIAKIMESDSKRSISELFDQLIRNDDYKKIELPSEIDAYFDQTGDLPDWADEKKIKIGQDVFSQFGPEICLLLLCKSLPEAYSCKKGALVLYKTGRMREGDDGSLKKFTRRLMETSQFVLNVCMPGGFSKEGNAIITAQKVRLIHAAIRYYIQKDSWDAAENGLPINQEDMAGTLQSFSALIIEGLGQLGVSLTNEQKEGYFHCWRIAGHIVGLDIQLNPETYNEGLTLGYAIFDEQRAASEAGTVLTKAVLDFMENLMPGDLFNHTPAIIMRYLLGDETADLLEVPAHDGLLAKIVPRLLKIIFETEEEMENHSIFMKKIGNHVSQALLQGMLNHFNEYKGIHFYIPPGLQENWKLATFWDTYTVLSPEIAGYRLALEKENSKIKK